MQPARSRGSGSQSTVPRAAKTAERGGQKTVSSLIREAIERNGYKDVKECARSIKVPYDLFNKVVGGHIPKDGQLIEYAKKLDIDYRELILAAYKEKAPDEMKRYFNSVNLLEDHNGEVREVMDIMDALTADQLRELVGVARLIRSSPREHCKKATALLSVYQQMDSELMEHFDSLVLMALRHHPLNGLQEFQSAVSNHRPARPARRVRA